MNTTKKTFDCISCEEADLRPGMIELPGTVRGETYTVRMQGLECPKCGYKTIEGPDMPEYSRLLADKYREAHGLLTSEAIRDRRKRVGMTQEEFAKYLGVGVASVKRWELGKIQDVRSNQLIVDRTDVSAVTQTAPNYAWCFAGGSSTFQSLNTGTVFVGASAIEPNPSPNQVMVIVQYIAIAMDTKTNPCGECKQTTSPAVILTASDHQSIPAYIASFANRSQERFSNGRRKQAWPTT